HHPVYRFSWQAGFFVPGLRFGGGLVGKANRGTFRKERRAVRSDVRLHRPISLGRPLSPLALSPQRPPSLGRPRGRALPQRAFPSALRAARGPFSVRPKELPHVSQLVARLEVPKVPSEATARAPRLPAGGGTAGTALPPRRRLPLHRRHR